MTVDERVDRDRSSTRAVVIAGVAPALAWAAFLLVGSQLDEHMCATGAAPARGRWFGLDVRVPLVVLAAGVLVATGVAAFVLLQQRSRAARHPDRTATTHHFLATMSLVSMGVFVPITVGTVVIMWVVDAC